jgi:hypothetical protein
MNPVRASVLSDERHHPDYLAWLLAGYHHSPKIALWIREQVYLRGHGDPGKG